MTEHVLISPLGFAPGAISGVYFALEKQKVKVTQVITVGTAHSHVRNAAATLESLFRQVGGVNYKPCYIDAQDLRGRERDASGPFAARMGLYIQQAHDSKQVVHVAVTGGRSGMGALAALAAQLYRADYLYHLWVDEEIEREGIARATPDPKNRYVNPTVAEGLCELVSLPFADLSRIVEALPKYRAGEPVPADWSASRLVGEDSVLLDTLIHYAPAGLSLGSARELLGLGEQWRSQVEWISGDAPYRAIRAEEVTGAHRPDVYWSYEAGLRQLLNRMKMRNHPDYSEALVYQQRLTENIAKVRLYGDTDRQQAERAEVIHHLNGLALTVLEVSFNDLCDQMVFVSPGLVWQRTLSILYTAGALDDENRERLQPLMHDSIGDDFAQRAIDKAGKKDDLGPLKWLAVNKDSLTVLVAAMSLGVNVGTFVLKGLELWLKAHGVM